MLSDSPPATKPTTQRSRSAPETLGSFDALAGELLAAANGRPGLAACELPLVHVKELLGNGLHEARVRADVSWRAANEGVSLLGFGSALQLDGPRGESFEHARSAASPFLDSPNFVTCTELVRPRFFGGGRFQPNGINDDPRWEDFGGWQLRMPRYLVAVSADATLGSVTAFLDGSETRASLSEQLSEDLDRALRLEPSHSGDRPRELGLSIDTYPEAVKTATEEISDGMYSKVVLARQKVVSELEPISIDAILSRLADRYPNCFIFRYRVDGGSWVGASPELLVSLRDGEAHAASLAASRPRGATTEEDERFAGELMSSHKEREEHRFVVAASTRALAPLSRSLEAPGEPTLLQLPNIQHLYTPITCLVNDGVNILDLVAQMHPTPAVGAWPRGETLATIERLEGMDRGWYAAPIGWLDLNGDGEFAVALRSALIQGNQATLYAGAGIVQESDPQSELAETELKFRPLMYALADD